MAIHIDDGLVVLLQHETDRVQRAVEAWHHCVLIGSEGDVGRHVQDDAVALAADRNARTLQLRAQFGFLAIHVNADSAAGQGTDASANQRIAAIIAAGQHAAQCTDTRAKSGTTGGVRNLLLTRIRICGACT